MTQRSSIHSDRTPGDRDFLRALVQAAPVAMFTLAIEDGSVVSTNPAFDALTGFDEDDRGRAMTSYVHPSDVQILVSNLHQVMLGSPPAPFELRLRSTRSRWTTAELTLIPRTHEGRLLQVLGFARDSSERRAVLRDLRAARDAAEAGSQAKTEFLANMSHEIRTPLNAVVAMSGLLLEMPLEPQSLSFAQIIRSSSQTLLELINSVLDFSKIDSDKLELENQPFSIEECIETSIDLVSTSASAKNLVVETEIDPHCPKAVYGDITRVRQVLVNLLSNAVKFTEAGSIRVAATSRPADDDDGGRAALQDEVVLTISVTDTGIGIPREKQAKIFDVFSQADASTTRRFGGTGLGLTISRRLTELMGGGIEVESEPGEGSTFRFSIRGRIAEAPASTQAPAPIDSTLAERLPLRILVAEDHPTNQLVARLLLQKMGYEPDIVDNGQEALDALQEREYDIVLMDVHMPVLDGLAATREIHRRMGADSPKIIAVTASMLKGDRERCLAAGVDDFLGKPIFSAELEASLQRMGGLAADAGDRVREAAADDPADDAAADRQVNDPVTLLERARAAAAADLAADGEPVVDLESLESLMLLGADNADQLVRSFLDSTDESIERLERAIADDDWTATAKAAHRMKGACALFGARRLQRLCGELEADGRSGPVDDGPARLGTVRAELERVVAILAG